MWWSISIDDVFCIQKYLAWLISTRMDGDTNNIGVNKIIL